MDGTHHHTAFWQNKKAKEPQKRFGVLVAKTWYWYENWLSEVENHCSKNTNKYK